MKLHQFTNICQHIFIKPHLKNQLPGSLRLGKEDAESLLHTCAMAIKAVSVGIMGTAFIAAIFSFIGLIIAGIPFSSGIATLVFFQVIIQVGPCPFGYRWWYGFFTRAYRMGHLYDCIWYSVTGY
ncbi:MAG: hypothetical protein ABIQ88_19875 [Chitinophagaceae bacterium]